MTRPMPNEDFAEMAAGMRRMQASFRLDGPGFITGVCVRDLG